uniref:Col_cuticle_N domain-containing protein n=1 Tax=Steinernema glaseri TaxID=37863 RepID=A0A1I7Z858_9BILA
MIALKNFLELVVVCLMVIFVAGCVYNLHDIMNNIFSLFRRSGQEEWVAESEFDDFNETFEITDQVTLSPFPPSYSEVVLPSYAEATRNTNHFEPHL